MTHPFLEQTAAGLCDRAIAALRYQFPYMEKRSGRPDPPAIAHKAVRAAVAMASSLAPGLPLFAGGKSFGGRMTSQAQALAPLPGVKGLIFLGFPLHPPGKPSTERAGHLAEIAIPMLFLQGDHDEFAEPSLLHSVIERLGKLATLHLVPHANHSFHVPARSGRTDAQVLSELLDVTTDWIRRIIS